MITIKTDFNSIKNQNIKAEFVSREVYCNVTSLVEYCLKAGAEDPGSPVSYDDIENLYRYPEWSKRVLYRDLLFTGGTEEQKEAFAKVFDEMTIESQELMDSEEISEVTHERNVFLIEEAREEFNNLEEEPAEVFEWWAVSSFLFDKLREQGEVVIDTGSLYLWGRQTTGQAIILDDVISRICSDMEILEGQKYEW